MTTEYFRTIRNSSRSSTPYIQTYTGCRPVDVLLVDFTDILTTYSSKYHTPHWVYGIPEIRILIEKMGLENIIQVGLTGNINNYDTLEPERPYMPLPEMYIINEINNMLEHIDEWIDLCEEPFEIPDRIFNQHGESLADFLYEVLSRSMSRIMNVLRVRQIEQFLPFFYVEAWVGYTAYIHLEYEQDQELIDYNRGFGVSYGGGLYD